MDGIEPMGVRGVLAGAGWGLLLLATAELGSCRQRSLEAVVPASPPAGARGLEAAAAPVATEAGTTPSPRHREGGTGGADASAVAPDDAVIPSTSASASALVPAPASSGRCRCRPDDPLCSCYGTRPERPPRSKCDCDYGLGCLCGDD